MRFLIKTKRSSMETCSVEQAYCFDILALCVFEATIFLNKNGQLMNPKNKNLKQSQNHAHKLQSGSLSLFMSFNCKNASEYLNVRIRVDYQSHENYSATTY